MATGITMDELLAALEKAGHDCDKSGNGQTTRELMVLWGCSIERARRLIKQAKAEGMVKVGSKPGTTIDNRPTHVSCYSFTTKGSKSKE